MNKCWVIPILAFAIAGFGAHVITQRVLSRRAVPAQDAWRNVSYLDRELNLTEEQTREVKSLHADLVARLADCCARHCAARARLPAALAAGTNGNVAAEAVVAEMAKAYEDSERATLAHLCRLRAALSPAQRRRFDALVMECLCGACNMPGGQSASGGSQP